MNPARATGLGARVAKNWGSRRNGAAAFLQTVVLAHPSPLYSNGHCVRELQALVTPKTRAGSEYVSMLVLYLINSLHENISVAKSEKWAPS